MVDLPPVMLSKEATTTAPRRDSDPSRSKEFNELFKQSVNKVATPESGIKKPEHGEILPNNSSGCRELASASCGQCLTFRAARFL